MNCQRRSIFTCKLIESSRVRGEWRGEGGALRCHACTSVNAELMKRQSVLHTESENCKSILQVFARMTSLAVAIHNNLLIEIKFSVFRTSVGRDFPPPMMDGNGCLTFLAALFAP